MFAATLGELGICLRALALVSIVGAKILPIGHDHHVSVRPCRRIDFLHTKLSMFVSFDNEKFKMLKNVCFKGLICHILHIQNQVCPM